MQQAAGNGLDVHAYPCVGVAARNRKNNCVHHPRYVRLSPGARFTNDLRAAQFRDTTAEENVAQTSGNESRMYFNQTSHARVAHASNERPVPLRLARGGQDYGAHSGNRMAPVAAGSAASARHWST
jgi:hypothetical protein